MSGKELKCPTEEEPILLKKVFSEKPSLLGVISLSAIQGTQAGIQLWILSHRATGLGVCTYIPQTNLALCQ